MFGRLKRGVARSGLKKYRFEMEVQVVALSAWPKGLKDCCVQLARSDKEVCTPFAAPTEGRLGWGGIEPLPLMLTLYQGPSCWDEKVRTVRRGGGTPCQHSPSGSMLQGGVAALRVQHFGRRRLGRCSIPTLLTPPQTNRSTASKRGVTRLVEEK